MKKKGVRGRPPKLKKPINDRGLKTLKENQEQITIRKEPDKYELKSYDNDSAAVDIDVDVDDVGELVDNNEVVDNLEVSNFNDNKTTNNLTLRNDTGLRCKVCGKEIKHALNCKTAYGATVSVRVCADHAGDYIIAGGE